MSSINRKLNLLVLGAFAGIQCMCGPVAIKQDLEVTVRYDTPDAARCVGEVRNISPQAFNGLQVEVEFQNAEGNRVRTGTESVLPKTLTPGTSGSFSVPYLKGSNDPPVVKCRVVEFGSSDGKPLLHTHKSGASGGS